MRTRPTRPEDDPDREIWTHSENCEHSRSRCVQNALTPQYLNALVDCQVLGSSFLNDSRLDSMKRTAQQAGFPLENQVIRVTVCVPPDRCTRNQQLTIPITCSSSDNIDAVKHLLQYRIKDLTGRRPQIECFQLQQNGRHVPFTAPVTELATLEVVNFVRTAPDYRDSDDPQEHPNRWQSHQW